MNERPGNDEPRFGRRADDAEVEAARYGEPGIPGDDNLPGRGVGSGPRPGDADPTDPAVPTDPAATEDKWWEDPRMPWAGKPGKQDLWCWIAIAAAGVFAVVMLILRPMLLGYNPYLLVALTGSRSGTVLIGALAEGGDRLWWIGLMLGTISVIKFALLYFWAGKLWGQGILDILVTDSPRARRAAARTERFARRFGVLAIAVSYLPIPIPVTIVAAVVGISGMRWRTFIITNLVTAFLVQSLWMYLGFAIGEPAVKVADLIAKYSLYLTIGLLVFVIIGAQIRKRRADKGRS